jgi:succinate-semialdehyde dehydrogenase/glutarate-semialdehyde dehydrogenase
MKIDRHLECSPIVAGDFLPSSSRELLPITNPADETVVGSLVCASLEDIHDALRTAEDVRHSWRQRSPAKRGAILTSAAALMRARIKENARLLTLEQGKTLAESESEWERAIETFEWHGEEAERLNATTIFQTSRGKRSVAPEPMGVAAAFTPWNYPAVIIARKLSAALVAGCPVILKAAEETPNTALAIAKALFDAGLPSGVLQVLFGNPSEISSALLASSVVHVMSFTGSTPVGKQLGSMAAGRLIRHVLELGGHSPVVISADADIESAATAIAAYKYDCAGQSCNAPSRVFIERAAFHDFLDAFVEISGNIRLGAGWQPEVNMGPMANPRRLMAMDKLVSDAKARGGKIACGGARLMRAGYFFPPTVLLDVPEGARIFVDEPFGPVLPITSVDTIDEGVRRANTNAYGLASYLFAGDPKVAIDVASRLEAGSVGVNQMKGVPPDAAVAGIKDSGYGYEGGVAGVEAFQNRKLISGANVDT